MSETKFDARISIEHLRAQLARYEENEELKYYDEDCYIQDVLFFLGKSIDDEEYNMAQGFIKFAGGKLHPLTERMQGSLKSMFKRNLGMKA